MTSSLRGTIIIFAFLFVQEAFSDLNTSTLAILAEMKSANNDADLLKIASDFTALRGDSVLMRDAIAISHSDLSDKPAGRAAIIRLLRLSLLLNSIGEKGEIPKWVVMEELIDTLTDNDLSALRRATGFPQLSDSIYYLLDRKPNLRFSPLSGEYTVVRIALKSRKTIVFERSTVPFMDLGPEWTKREILADMDLVQIQDTEQAQTRRFSIRQLPNIVLAAKAFRIAELTKTPLRGYAAYVASEAIADGLSGLGLETAERGEIGLSVWGIQQWTLNILKEYPSDSFLSQLSKQVHIKLPATVFSARAFPEAAKFYKDALGTNQERKLWSTWGEGISSFAAREYEKSTEAFQRMSPLFYRAKNADSYAYIFMSFYRNLPERDIAALGELYSVLEAANKKLSSTKFSLEKTISLDKDFTNIMVTIGRIDIAILHLIKRLNTINKESSVDKINAETSYLWELGALSRDLCYDISWTMSSSSGWMVRPTIGYPSQLDFLHNKKNGRLVAPGEVVTLESGTPYGMLNPEEDCATVVAVYGVIEPSQTSAVFLPATPIQEKGKVSLGFKKWTIKALNRKSPKPSIAPLLKLVWVEWFSQQFESLKTGITAREFIYRPKNNSGITDLQQVSSLKLHTATTSQQRELIDLFLTVREVLEQRYNYAMEGKK
ncbi:MAG: hypothetical protein R3F53_05925 [Gammaproteobacteria bacterium]